MTVSAYLQNFVEYNIAQIYTGTADPSHKSVEKGLQGLDWLHAQKVKEPYYRILVEIKILYNWWRFRTERTNAWKNIDTIPEKKKEEWLHTTEDKNSEYKEYMDKCRYAEKLQTLYNNEDTKMLLRLIPSEKLLVIDK